LKISWAVLIIVSILIIGTLDTAQSMHLDTPFTFFDPGDEGFTQEVYGIHDAIMGGVAFAPSDGDPLVTFGCPGTTVTRFDRATTFVMASTTLHTATLGIPIVGCGLTNHPDRFIYTNTAQGIKKFDETGTEFSIGGMPLGGAGFPGNKLGIATQPRTGLIFYVNVANDIEVLDPTTGLSSTLLSVGGFIDDVLFDPTGRFLYLAQRDVFSVQVVDVTIPSIITTIPLPTEPDGMGYHAPSDTIFVTSIVGTIERVDPVAETVSLFASGGFRGDLAEVGPDGCLYLTQKGVRFDDGTLGSPGVNSLVRICGEFVPPPPPPPTPSPTKDGADFHEPPTIGMSSDGVRQVVENGICIDFKCWTVTETFYQDFDLVEMLSGRHTISNTIYCVNGVDSCNHLSLAVSPYNSDINSAFWRISIDKNLDDIWSLTEEFDPDDYIGDITWTTQIIENKYLGTSVTIDFKKPMDGNMLIIQPWDYERGVSNFLFNDGIAVLDSYAYPTIEIEYEEQLIVQKLCLNESPDHRTTCAFAKKVDMEIKKAEMIHDKLLSTNVFYRFYS